MKSPYRLPQGVTYRTIAKKFQEGQSVYTLAARYTCLVGTIEDAIRAVLKRQR